MNCAIISVGTELLMGQVTDTNAVYLSQQMNLLGIDVLYRYTVGDNDGRLQEILETALQDCDLVLTTGGLGPTEDDMTKETVTRVMGDHLVRYEQAAEALRQLAEKRGIAFTENNFKQTMLPSRADIFDTDAGTAPGFALTDDLGRTVICMPGPPREMRSMFEHRISKYLRGKTDSALYYRVFRIFGIGESKVETDLLDLIDAQTDPTIATYAKNCECSVRIATKQKTAEDAERAMEPLTEEIRKRFGVHIYSENGKDLPHTVGEELIRRHLTISASESCTGGRFAFELTTVPGISEVFERGIVTYTERAKMEELGVFPETLKKETAVSPRVAYQMAEGLYRKTGSDICVSVTGTAGPGGGTDVIPVGTIYVGCRMNGETKVAKLMTGSTDREWNREYAVSMMFFMIYLGLKNKTASTFLTKKIYNESELQ
ncbi:MAG: competence/damage-inducible protein A [Eubacteriales bacterium]|nr:competence/damage-inducible protein A [Eubacteriales bacterium]